MSWVKLDDKLPHHPKIVALGNLRHPAIGLHIEALCYCSEYLTDGVVPSALVRKMPRRLVEALLSVGLWHRLGDGAVSLHDFLDYNPSRETVEAKRQDARVRMNNSRSSREVHAPRVGASRPVPSRPLPQGSTRSLPEYPHDSIRLVEPSR